MCDDPCGSDHLPIKISIISNKGINFSEITNSIRPILNK